MRSLTIATEPAVEPVTLDEAKEHLRVTDNSDDGYIAALVKAARQWAEAFTRRAIITQTWDMYLDGGFPACVEVPLPPLQSVTAASFVYVDTDGNSTQVTESVYTVDTDSTPGRIYEAYNQTWPSVRDQEKNVTVRFVAGYGVASAVPEAIKQAILIMSAHWYEHREPAIVGTIISDVPMSAQNLLAPYVVAQRY